MQAILALEDGRIFRGKGHGAKAECYGEVVFNTSLTGYQEIFTDPSYSGQIVVLTNPEIGNYGTNQDDNEATRPWIEGLIVREFSKVSSNWRSQQVAEECLEQFKLRGEGCKVTVVPAQTPAEDVLALKPDGVFLSNGPGDPEPCTYAVDSIRRLMGRQPIFGICLGHQLTGIALGGKTFKLKFGHHGGNHPVKQLKTGKIEITAHNHNFAVDPDSLAQSEVELTHMK